MTEREGMRVRTAEWALTEKYALRSRYVFTNTWYC